MNVKKEKHFCFYVIPMDNCEANVRNVLFREGIWSHARTRLIFIAQKSSLCAVSCNIPSQAVKYTEIPIVIKYWTGICPNASQDCYNWITTQHSSKNVFTLLATRSSYWYCILYNINPFDISIPPYHFTDPNSYKVHCCLLGHFHSHNFPLTNNKYFPQFLTICATIEEVLSIFHFIEPNFIVVHALSKTCTMCTCIPKFKVNLKWVYK